MWKVLASLFFPLLVIFLLYGNSGMLFQNQFDDSYITYRYAANLALGKGLVFNPGDYTDAASSFLYTLILSGFYYMGLTSLDLWGALINILLATGVCYLVYKSVLKLTQNQNLSLILSILTGLHGFISTWAVSGMETILFTFLVTAFIYQEYFQEKPDETLKTLTMIGILLTRFEGVILFIIWVLSKSISKTFLLQFSLCLSILTLFYYFQYRYYGEILPNSFEFKRLVEFYKPNPTSLIFVWTASSGIFWICGIGSFLLSHLRRYKTLYLYILISFISFILGPYSDSGRYSVHIFPALVILSAPVFESILSNFYSYKNLVSLVLVLFLTIQTLFSSIFISSKMLNIKNSQICRKYMGDFLVKNTTPQDYVLSGDIGIVAYTALNTQFLDITGLTSKEVLSSYKKRESLDKIIMKKEPKYIADTFLKNKDNKIYHPLLLNQNEYVKGLKTYNTIFILEDLQNIVYKCDADPYIFAVVDLQNVYK